MRNQFIYFVNRMRNQFLFMYFVLKVIIYLAFKAVKDDLKDSKNN